ncbi:hypothetical protein HG535_0F01780 [Zygotorulaspora mrakii]|uniref:Uncharacterized protein n=1 Tax=Zygotorulaspora mrakii TaxID=42260 RepID=A0A7H9B555_ZYGMR|nr:uncharacterized protein HG535_0F01780 [Zygotorulaspora mrakii]QLG73667.1 hypothetical protein HG535_0F01780 [Zygotorulaspora mrakii]
MPPYLLKRRLRHIRSIKLSNIAISEANSITEHFQLLSCFITLESHKGQLLYVSELQEASMNMIQFNELPKQDNPITSFLLKILISAPDNPNSSPLDVPADNEKMWIFFRKYNVDLNKLRRMEQDEMVENCNYPIFEIVDGLYVLPDALTVSMAPASGLHRRTPSNYKVKQSFSFNSVLKLTMITEYMRQIKDETEFTSHRLDKLMRSVHKETDRIIKVIKNSNEELKKNIERKKESKKNINESFRSPKHARQSSLVSQHPSLNDYYGNTYSDFIQVKNRLELIRSKKVNQLISVFQGTVLFDPEVGFLELRDSPSSSVYDKIKLKLLDEECILSLASKSEVERYATNASLGYYLLFILLMANEVFEVPLPYSLHFYGSTSIVETNHPLYLENSIALKNLENFSKAVSYFNRDIVQIIQNLELRQTL